MKSYGQFCPVAMALELLAERWTLLVVRELLSGARRFNDMSRGVPQMSRTMLSQRLKTLEDAGVVLRVPATSGGTHEYCLTQAGKELEPIVLGLGKWGQRWASQEIKDEHLDASLLMWDMHRRVDVNAVPAGRVVVRFDFTDAPTTQRRYWLKLEDRQPDVCFTDPGFDVQAILESDVRTLTEIWMGRIAFGQALRDKRLSITGKSTIVRQLPHWLMLNLFADIEPQPTQRAGQG